MKKYFVLVLTIIAIFIIIIFFPGINSTALNPFQKKSLQTRTLDNLETIKVAQYSSARYRYKSLFPFDFIYGDPIWGTLLYKNSRFLTDEEKLNKEFYYSCKSIGLDLNKNNYFFTITTIVSAGLNMEPYLKDPIIFFNDDRGLIIIKKPKSEILSIEVEDSLRDEDYPQIQISPGQWQQLITLLLPKIENDVITTGLLETADVGNESFIKKLFLSIGWDKVEFK